MKKKESIPVARKYRYTPKTARNKQAVRAKSHTGNKFSKTPLGHMRDGSCAVWTDIAIFFLFGVT